MINTVNLTIDKSYFNNEVQTITSLEVAEMVEKQHKELLRDIRTYIEYLKQANEEIEELGERKIALVDFFQESTYIDGKGETRPCYNITRKGCEYIATKLTGVKGAKFTARYINRFHDMEDYIKGNNQKDENSMKFLMCLQGVKFLADDMRLAESSRLFMYNGAFEEFGLPTSFLPYYEDNGNRERCSATELLNRNNCEIKTAKFNQLMITAGYMELKERPSSKGGTKEYKSLTDKGLKYGVNLISNKNQKKTQPYYYADTFMELYETTYILKKV